MGEPKDAFEAFSSFSKYGALLTVGNKEKFNMMTIGWGGLGTLWGRPVATVFVRPSRYTHEFIEKEDYFTIGIFENYWYKDELKKLGTNSGRDMDKMHDSGLTPMEVPNGMTFKEVSVTLICKKIFKQRLDPSQLPADIQRQYYEDDEPHDMFVGEVVDKRFIKYFHNGWGIFKEGYDSRLWEACYDVVNDRYSVFLQVTSREGCREWIYEINKEIYDKLGTAEAESYQLVQDGRCVYLMGDESMGPPWENILDENYKAFCPWHFSIDEEK